MTRITTEIAAVVFGVLEWILLKIMRL